MIEALVVAVCAAANRLAGGGLWVGALWDSHRPDKLWGRAMYLAALLVGAVATLAHPPLVAAAWVVVYAAWRSIEHGRWFDLHRLPDGYAREGKKRTPFEKVAEGVSFGSDHVALFWRHITILPGLALIAWLTSEWWFVALAPAFALLTVGAYEIGHRVAPTGGSSIGQQLVGFGLSQLPRLFG